MLQFSSTTHNIFLPAPPPGKKAPGMCWLWLELGAVLLKNDPAYWGEEPLKMPMLTRVEPLGGEVGASEGLMPLNDDKLLTFIRGGSSHSLQQETLQHLRYLFTGWYLTDIFLVARCFLCLKGPGRLFPNLCKTPNKEPAMNATCRNN